MMIRNLSIVAILFFSTPSWASQGLTTVGAVKAQIEQVKMAIAEEEKAWAEEKSREASSEASRIKRYDSFKIEKSELRNKIASLKQSIDASYAKMEVLKRAKRSVENEIESYRKVILELANELSQRLETSFPYQKEKRIELAGVLVSDLRQEKISPEEGFNRLWGLYTKEHRIASEAEVYTGDAKSSTGDISVKYVRVGKQILLYADAAGKNLGKLEKNNEEWTWVNQDDMDYDKREAIRQAVAVAEGKAPPSFVALPFWKTELMAQKMVQIADSAKEMEVPNAKK